MEIYTNETENFKTTLSDYSGVVLFRGPSNYTADSFQNVIVLEEPYIIEGVMRALDDLSDEVGITHETVIGEILEENDNHAVLE